MSSDPEGPPAQPVKRTAWRPRSPRIADPRPNTGVYHGPTPWSASTCVSRGQRALRSGSHRHDTVPFEVRRLRAQENGPRNAQGTRRLTRLPRIMLLPARRNTAHDRACLVSAHSAWGILAEQSTIGGDGWES